MAKVAHAGNDENSLLMCRHHMTLEIPPRTSKVAATNNLKTLIIWSC